MLGKLLQGRYQVFQVLSGGGFCQTYLAQDTYRPGYPTCVVKHLKPVSNHPESLQTLRGLFTRETEALKRLGDYDKVPQLLAHFEENQDFYLVQEFIEGHPLSAELLPGSSWTESQVVQLLQEVLSILVFVHCHGLIHRDIKPSNLIRRQQDGRLVLIDFGAVKQVWTQVVTELGQTNATFAIGIPATIVIGTPGYMPTEQGRGRPRPNSDIYALGMIGIQALTGRFSTQLLEDSNTGEVIWQHHANVSDGLACVLNQMVRYHFKDRYQSAIEVLQALQPLANLHPPLPQQQANSRHPSTRHEAPPQPSVTVTLVPQSPPSGQDTIPVSRGNRAQAHLDDKTSDATVATSPNKSALLIGIGVGIVSVLFLMVAIYYLLQVPAPAPKVKKYAVSIPIKNTSVTFPA